jgi:ankyrin repeat protein
MANELKHVIERNDKSSLLSLISTGDVNLNDPPLPLLIAASLGRLELMAVLLDAGADINAVNVRNETACHIAIELNQPDALKLLLERGADLRAVRRVAELLFKGVSISRDREPRMKIISVLLQAGAPIESLTVEERLHLALWPKSVVVLKCLKARNVDLGTLRDEYDRTLYHRAIEIAGLAGDAPSFLEPFIRTLCDAGVDVDFVDKLHERPIHAAAGLLEMTSLRVLAELGADIDSRDYDGMSALHRVCKRDKDGTYARTMLAMGADVHLTSTHGLTACHWAAKRGRAAALCACVAAGGDLDQTTRNRFETARTFAAENDCALPTADEVEAARRSIAKTRLDFVRRRALEVCIGLQPLNLDALQMCEIMKQSCGAFGSLIPFHQWWTIAIKVKHFVTFIFH